MRDGDVATAFDDCLCPIRGHCVPGDQCPAGEHVDASACQEDRPVSYGPDNDFFHCKNELDKCMAKWPQCKPIEKCKKTICRYEGKDCDNHDEVPEEEHEQCEKLNHECEEKQGCKPDMLWDEQYGTWLNCHDICKHRCTLHVDEDLKLKVVDRHIIVDHSQGEPDHHAIVKGSELVEIDGDENGPWRTGGENVLHNLDWSRGHTLIFKGPMPEPNALEQCQHMAPGLGQDLVDALAGHLPEEDEHLRDPAPEGCGYVGGCGQGRVCCSMGSTRPEPSEEFVVKCRNQKEHCKPPEICPQEEGRLGVCKYQVREM